MVNEVKQEIMNKLNELYPTSDGYSVYGDNVPQDCTTPYFSVLLTRHEYGKRIGNKYKGTLSFDLAYYSNKEATEQRSDCYRVQETVLRAFGLVGTYRIKNKVAQITDNVLHVSFDVNYSEMENESVIYMQQAETSTII